jgi:hypothetical protein
VSRLRRTRTGRRPSPTAPGRRGGGPEPVVDRHVAHLVVVGPAAGACVSATRAAQASRIGPRRPARAGLEVLRLRVPAKPSSKRSRASAVSTSSRNPEASLRGSRRSSAARSSTASTCRYGSSAPARGSEPCAGGAARARSRSARSRRGPRRAPRRPRATESSRCVRPRARPGTPARASRRRRRRRSGAGRRGRARGCAGGSARLGISRPARRRSGPPRARLPGLADDALGGVALARVDDHDLVRPPGLRGNRSEGASQGSGRASRATATVRPSASGLGSSETSGSMRRASPAGPGLDDPLALHALDSRSGRVGRVGRIHPGPGSSRGLFALEEAAARGRP